MGGHVIKSWASKQTAIALSNGEADFYAIVEGTSSSMGIQSVLRDLGVHLKLRVFTGATTGKSLCSRKGLGKVRHIATSELWVQEKVQDGAIEVTKLKGSFNTADMLTKHLAQADLRKCVEILGHEYAEGRSAVAPEMGMSEQNAMLPSLYVRDRHQVLSRVTPL